MPTKAALDYETKANYTVKVSIKYSENFAGAADETTVIVIPYFSSLAPTAGEQTSNEGDAS